MKGVSPIFSAILLLIIAISIAAVFVILMWRSYTQSQSVVTAMATALERIAKTSLSIVYTGYGKGNGYIGIYNDGSYPVDILAIYANGMPVNLVTATCNDGTTYSDFPITIKPGSLCIVVVKLGPPALYEVSIVTKYITMRTVIAG